MKNQSFPYTNLKILLNNKTLYFFVVVICTLWTFTALDSSAENYQISPPPEWIIQHQVTRKEKTPKPFVSKTTEYLLVDKQVRMETQHIYYHYAYEILSTSGLEEAMPLSLEFDPSYQKLVIHAVNIIKPDAVISVSETEKITFLQREKDLERNIYDGRITAVIFPEGVEVGDIIELQYSLIGENPIFAGKFLYRFVTQWHKPIHRIYQRIICPSERKIYIKNHNTDLSPQITEESDYIEYLWENRNIKAVIDEGDNPSWYYIYPWIQISEFENWREVNNWAAELYGFEPGVPGDLPEKLTETLASLANKEERIVALTRYVQNKIRYLGIELGVYSHLPTPPNTTLKRKFGDCKDKSLLLCYLLKSIGIEAYPVLVNIDLKQRLKEQHPSPSAFNHVVVCIKYKEKNYWTDPAIDGQSGDLDHISFPDYRIGLVVDGKSNDLTRIPFDRKIHHVSIQDNFEIRDYTSDVRLNSLMKYSGRNADLTRRFFAQNSTETVEKSYLNYIAKWYPEIKRIERIRYKDDVKKNQVTIEDHYRITNFWKISEDNQVRLGLFGFYDIFEMFYRPITTLRKQSLGIPYPLSISQTIHARLPTEWNVTEEDKSIETDYLTFKMKVKLINPKELFIYWETETKTDFVPPDKVASYLKTLEEVERVSTYEISSPIWLEKFDKFTSEHELLFGYLVLLFFVLVCSAIWLMIFFVKKRRRKKRQSMTATAQNLEFAPEETLVFSNVQAPWRLVLLSLVTFSIYEFYWFYRNWKHLKLHKNLDIKPGWRTLGLFIPIYNIVLIYRQFRDIRVLADEAGCGGYASPGWLTFGYVFLTSLSHRLTLYTLKVSDAGKLFVFTILGLLIDLSAVGLLVVVQKTLNQYWKKERSELQIRQKFSGGEFFLITVGAIWWIISIIGMFFPE